MTKITEIKEQLSIPDGVQVTREENKITVTGPKGSLTKQLAHPRITLTIKDNTVEVICSHAPHRKERALVGTFTAHIKNMFKGVTDGFEYTMRTVFSHFPIKTVVEGNEFVIQNFLGERSPRKAQILEGVTVDVHENNVTVSGMDKEKVGQTAANIERATRVKKRDIRVFQDGVYIISKRG